MKSVKLKNTMAANDQKMCETLDELRERTPNFSIFRVEKNFAMMTFAGDRLDFKEGKEYCFNSEKPPGANMVPAEKSFKEVYTPYNGQNLDGKVLGVWRSGGIGDLIFIRPVLVHLKKLYPTCKIYFATRARYHGMLKHWDDCLDGIEDYPFPCDHVINEADYHLTFQGVIEDCQESNEQNVYDVFARFAGLEPEEVEFNVPMELPSISPAIGLLKGAAVVQTMASSPVRTPKMRTYIKVINHLTRTGLKVVISDGPNNEKRTDHLISCVESPDQVFNLCYYTKELIDAINLVDAAPIVVSPDSSHTHFAGAQKTPVVGLYGPFPGRCRATHYENCILIETPYNKQTCEHGGRECFLHNQNGCQFHERCWLNIDDDAVLSAIDQLLDKKE